MRTPTVISSSSQARRSPQRRSGNRPTTSSSSRITGFQPVRKAMNPTRVENPWYEKPVMAKKKPTASADRVNKRVKERDKATLGKIVNLADNVSKAAFKGGDISVAIPQRTRSNTIWNKRERILQMGQAKATRELFNLNQAK